MSACIYVFKDGWRYELIGARTHTLSACIYVWQDGYKFISFKKQIALARRRRPKKKFCFFRKKTICFFRGGWRRFFLSFRHAVDNLHLNVGGFPKEQKSKCMTIHNLKKDKNILEMRAHVEL
jgi:hypothetical protein